MIADMRTGICPLPKKRAYARSHVRSFCSLSWQVHCVASSTAAWWLVTLEDILTFAVARGLLEVVVVVLIVVGAAVV